MKSFTALRNLFGTLSNNTASANLTLGDELLNDAYRTICTSQNWHFLQRSVTASTVASTQFYNLPFNYDKLIGVTVTIGSTVYTPREVPSREFWDRLNASTNVKSNTPEWYYIFNNQLGFYPTPSGATTNGITYYYRIRITDLNVADYSTGTVDAITNASATVTGSGTTWASPMIGRFLRVTQSNAAASSGDHVWYEISTVASATSLTLTRNYNGTTLSAGAGAAYVIGQMPLLPEAYHELPLWRALQIYYTSVQPEISRSQLYGQMYTEGFARLKADQGSKVMSPVIDDGMDRRYLINPNLTIQL